MAWDLNRSLAWPVRVAHAAWEGVACAVVHERRVWRRRFAGRFGEGRGPVLADAVVPAVVLVVLAAAVFPFDGAIESAAAWVRGRVGGDVRRELQTWQQFGAIGSVVFTMLVVWRLDRERGGRRLWDLVVASAGSAAACWVLKMLVGRPRPKFGDAQTLLTPWGVYPVRGDDGVMRLVHAWGGVSAEGAGARAAGAGGMGGGSELWSMPSSHTAAAVALAVWLGAMYPGLRGVVWALVVLVGAARVLFGAHWASDVLVGAAVGWCVSWLVVMGGGRGESGRVAKR